MTGWMTPSTQRSRVLIAIRIAHTAIWAFFVGCILAIPVVGALRRFQAAWILIAIVAMECLALAANRGRCPLTPVAARFTTEWPLGFDIYLPGWLVRWNKQIFGLIFLTGALIVLWRQFR